MTGTQLPVEPVKAKDERKKEKKEEKNEVIPNGKGKENASKEEGEDLVRSSHNHQRLEDAEVAQ